MLKVAVQESMKVLACEDIEDLREFLSRRKWSLQIPLESETDEGKEFELFIEQAMKPML